MARAAVSAVYAVAGPFTSRLSEDVFRCCAATMLSPERRSISQVRRQRRHAPPAPLGLLALPTWSPYLRTRQYLSGNLISSTFRPQGGCSCMFRTQTFCSCANKQRQLLRQQ